MKKIALLSTGLTLISALVSAQTLSLTGYGGYTFQDRVNFSNAYGYVNGGGHWGLGVEGISREGSGLELLYQQQKTRIPLYYYNFADQVNKDADKADVAYVMLNGIHYLQKPKVQPYFGLGIGVAIVNSESSDPHTKVAWDLKLGAKLKVSSRVGIKVQTQLYSIVQVAGTEIYAGTGGTGVTIASNSNIYQFGFSGGICLDLEKKRLP